MRYEIKMRRARRIISVDEYKENGRELETSSNEMGRRILDECRELLTSRTSKLEIKLTI